MSPAILSVCLLATLTKPLSPAELGSRPEPGSLAYSRYVIRAAFSVRKGMTMDEAGAILGRPGIEFGGAASVSVMYPEPGVWVYFASAVVAGGEEYRVERVKVSGFPALRPRPAAR